MYPWGLPGWLGTARVDRLIRNLGDPASWVGPDGWREVIIAVLGKGRDKRYLNLFPSKKSLASAREKLKDMTSSSACHVRGQVLIQRVNRFLVGWSNCFKLGYPRDAFRQIDWFVQERRYHHLERRSQRPYRPPQGKSFPAHLTDLGLVTL